MEDFQQPVKELITVLKEARAKARAIKDLSEPFLIKVDNTLARLINSSAHAVGLPIEEAEGMVIEERGPVTSMFGKDLSKAIAASEAKAAKLNVTEDVLAKLRAETATIIARIPELSPKQFHEQYQDAQIRRVAKKLGIAVTTTDPEQITLEFVRQLFEVAASKADKAKAIADADVVEAKEVEAQTGQEAAKPEASKEPHTKPAQHSSNAVPSSPAIGKKPTEKPKPGKK